MQVAGFLLFLVVLDMVILVFLEPYRDRVLMGSALWTGIMQVVCICMYACMYVCIATMMGSALWMGIMQMVCVCMYESMYSHTETGF